MKSTILTKVNKVTPRNFMQQIEWSKGESDTVFLEQFIKHCHKNGDIVERSGNKMRVVTRDNYYIFTAYQNHICRVDANNSKKQFYQIS